LDPSIELGLAEVGTIKTLLSIHLLHFTCLLVHSALEVDTTHAVLALACPLACCHYLPFEPSLYSIAEDSTFVAAATRQGELAQLFHLPAQGCLQGNKPADLVDQSIMLVEVIFSSCQSSSHLGQDFDSSK